LGASGILIAPERSYMATLKIVLIVLAVVFFVLAFFNVPRYNWTAGGFACIAAALLLI